MVAFLAALGPLLAKGGALAAKGAAGASKFAAAHPKLTKMGLGALGGGLTQEFGGDEAYNVFLQQLLANQQNGGRGQQIGSNELPGMGTIIN